MLSLSPSPTAWANLGFDKVATDKAPPMARATKATAPPRLRSSLVMAEAGITDIARSLVSLAARRLHLHRNTVAYPCRRQRREPAASKKQWRCARRNS